jgi:hypothetical protein
VLTHTNKANEKLLSATNALENHCFAVSSLLHTYSLFNALLW